jgi:uncharacterized protein (DUF952 family)
VATIYRIVSATDWRAAQAAGVFRGTAHDLRDGFLHFSTWEQVAETAARHYAGLPDLMLLYVDVDRLPRALEWEVSRNGELFPHLYDALPISAVARAEDLPLGSDGRHIWPES